MDENSTTGAFVSEVIWVVGTVAVSYIAIATGRKAWKLGKTLVSSRLQKGSA